MTDTAARKAQLESRREELLARMAEVDRELDSHTSKDWEDSATEREDDEVLERMGAAARAEVAQIDAALGRIAAGDYGHCARCGSDIAEARLDLVPFTPLCQTCAR